MFNNNIDAYLVFSHSNRYYFTGIDTSFGCVILTKNEKVFFTDFRYENEVRKNLIGFTIKIVTFKELYPKILTELKRLGANNLGYEDDIMTLSEYSEMKDFLKDYNLIAAGGEIKEARAVKTEKEIENIIAAQRVAEKALTKILPLFKVGVTEQDMHAELIFEIIKNGAESTSFETIIAFGENSASPHHKPSDKKLEKNDLILVDFGAKLKGYCSDMTRTFCLGEPDPKLDTIHSIVAEAQNYALKHIKAGMTCNEADSLAREYIIANGFGSDFGHGLGHGIGLDIHELPRLAKGNNTILLPNMVVTVEPGIYISGLGGVRIEDTIIIKEDGNTNITNFSKNINIKI